MPSQDINNIATNSNNDGKRHHAKSLSLHIPNVEDLSRTVNYTVKPITKTLSPITSTMHMSLSNLTRFKPQTTEKTLKRLSDDVGAPGGMAKSFVSMLTAASVYAGMDGEDFEGEHLNDELDDQTTIGSKPTLFELSVEPNYDAASIRTTTTSKIHDYISSKLHKRFELETSDEFIQEFPCWLLKDVLLQGHLYITRFHILFLAYLPKENGEASISGSLNTSLGSISARTARYWVILKDHTMRLYNSSSDLYFPVATVDLRTALRAEEDGESFTVVTSKKTYKFQADSVHSSRNWVGTIKKRIFANQNKDTECVTVKIPLQNMLDMETNEIVEGANTIRFRILESSDSYAVDDYFFMFFNNHSAKALSIIADAVEDLRMSESKLLRPPGETPVSSPEIISSLANSSSVDPNSAVRTARALSTGDSEKSRREKLMGIASVLGSPYKRLGIDYALGRVAGKLYHQDYSKTSSNDSESVVESAPASVLSRWTPQVIKNMGSMWSANPVHYQDLVGEQSFVSKEEKEESNARFRSHFSFDSEEFLISTYYAYLQRNIPVYGKIYVSNNHVCFRSLLIGTKTTMILPIKDIENVCKERAFRFTYYGLVVVIHGFEELFFEFAVKESRDDAEYTILKRMDILKPPKSNEIDTIGDDLTRSLIISDNTASSKIERAKIRLFEDKISSEVGVNIPIIVEENPYFRTNVKPSKSYRFGLLTIGSRGDVQPYIALAKRLLKEGHKVTIITHEEFREWVQEKHGIDFNAIAGNPAELMALMGSHGSMNVSLLKEASEKFRGWIDELLQTSWLACQDIDILIESPSTMAGIHIAEALQIPYFRAFTMPWTRTRAYPHAFIVPDQKKGGSYNYLTHVLFENVFWRGISGQVNKWRVETLQLPKTNLDLLQQNKVPFLYNISPTIFPPSVDFSDWVKVTGYWFLDEKTTYEPPQSLLEFMKKARDDDKKVVYIGFGSIVVERPRELTIAIVKAVTSADVYCILNKGWSSKLQTEPEEPIELPSHVYDSGSIPHDWLFPKIDAAVHHGGSGTTGATMRAGLPTIIKPFFGDQFFYANRVEDIGAGVALRNLTSSALAKAIKEVTTSHRIIAKAKSVAEEISKETGVDTAIDCIYTQLEYAKSLVVAKAKRNASDLNNWTLL